MNRIGVHGVAATGSYNPFAPFIRQPYTLAAALAPVFAATLERIVDSLPCHAQGTGDGGDAGTLLIEAQNPSAAVTVAVAILDMAPPIVQRAALAVVIAQRRREKANAVVGPAGNQEQVPQHGRHGHLTGDAIRQRGVHGADVPLDLAGGEHAELLATCSATAKGGAAECGCPSPRSRAGSGQPPAHWRCP